MGRLPEDYRERLYRRQATAGHLVSFRVQVRQSDIYIRAARDLSEAARASLIQHRSGLESYIAANPAFLEALTPLPLDPLAPPLVSAMLEAGRAAGVGPMAAVAGAIAEAVGRDLTSLSPEVVVENGGDIWLSTPSPCTVAIFAGPSPLSNKVGLYIRPEISPLSVCTSSASVGHSLSYGKADAAVALTPSGALADAAATAIGNAARGPHPVEAGLEAAQSIPGLLGAVVIAGERLGAWGEAIELVSLE
jgi:ApbE superfamily uncharacterized protein (UPF0280 family)